MSKASQTKLNELHGVLAKKIMDKLQSPDCSAQDIAQAIKFLKDNNVIADPEFNQDLKNINDKVNIKDLPFPVKEQ